MPLDLTNIRGIMIGILEVLAPEIFTQHVGSDNRTFRCSESFVGRFVKRQLRWSKRKGTQAGQKLPANASEQMKSHAFRLAIDIRDHSIPACCCANCDQTGNTYSQPGACTYDPIGTNQVTIVGKEDKRAFTIMVGVSMSGEVLPFQIMYAGKTPTSLPGINDPKSEFKAANNDAKKLGFRFEPSGVPGNHWSNITTMKSYVRNVLSVYFDKQRTLLKRKNQVCLWIIDCWSVHRSQEFRNWMQESYPWILVRYVPGGCTGVFQPCDVGIQRILKHAMKKTALSHIVKETVAHLNNNEDPGTILLAKTIGVLRNRSVEWLVNGYNAINKPEVVKKVHTPSFHPQRTRTYESSDTQLGLGVVQSWRDQSLVRMFDVSRSSSGPGRPSQYRPKTS